MVREQIESYLDYLGVRYYELDIDQDRETVTTDEGVTYSFEELEEYAYSCNPFEVK